MINESHGYFAEVNILSENNLEKDIDSAVVNELDKYEPLRTNELKRRLKNSLGRVIPSRTYYNHLNSLMACNIIKKQDDGKRGVESVFYFLTKEAKIQKKLRIIKTDPKCDSFKQIYINLFFRILPKGQLVEITNLAEIPLRLQIRTGIIPPLRVEKSDNSSFSCDSVSLDHEQTTINEIKGLFSFAAIHSLPNSEKIRMAYLIDTNRTSSKYKILLHGTSIANFVTGLHNFKPSMEDTKEAFNMLLKNRIIEPLMELKGETIYHLKDDKLNHLVCLLSFFYILENLFQLCIKENILEGNKADLKARRKLFVSDDALLEIKRVFDLREIRRYQMKRIIIKRTSKKDFLETKDDACEIFEKSFVLIASLIREECKNTIEEYSFLSDIFKIVCPLLFEQLLALGENPNTEYLKKVQYLADSLKLKLDKINI